MGCGCMKIVSGVLLAGGLLLVVLGFGLGWGAFPGIVEKIVEESLDLTDENSEGSKNFKSPPVPVYMKFTFYDIQNAETFIKNEEKAVFVEKGPYTYREIRMKQNYTYGDQYLEYSQYRHFEFQPDLSCQGCSKDDPMTILNMPLLGAVDAAFKTGSSMLIPVALKAIAAAIDITESSTDIVLTDTVDNLLFNGVSKESNALVNVLLTNGLFKNKLPPAIQVNGFAIFNSKNATTHNENYRVGTTPETHTEIQLWGMELDELVANLSTTRTCPSIYEEGGDPPACGAYDNPTWWPNPDVTGEVDGSNCNVIRGTNAEQFPPFLKDRKDDPLWIFTTDLCRSMYMKFVEEDKIEGIKVYKYSVPTDGGNINKKDNFCFCKDFAEKKNEGCVKNSTVDDEFDLTDCEITTCHDGLQNVENCMKSPVVMSSPHFYMAEQQLDHFSTSFKKPAKEDDETYLNIEPVTGMVLKAHKRIQVNMPIVPTNRDEIPFLKDITHVPAFPVLWLDEGADIDQNNIDKVKGMVTIPLLALDIVKYGMIGVGGVIMLVGMGLCFC